jgi:DNA-binding beta-propeller fold protein YncE
MLILNICTILYKYSSKDIVMPPLGNNRFFKFNLIAFAVSVLLVYSVNTQILSGSPLTTPINKVQESYYFVNGWGSKGTGDGQFLRPHDLEFDKNDKYLYVVDRDNNRIQVFDNNGTFLFKFGQKGQGDGQFMVPYGLDVDARGHLWIVDRGNHRVQEFDSKGNFISKFGNTDGQARSEPGKFDNPRHIEVDKALKYVYVADSKNNRIQQFDINGNFVRVIGHLGNKSGEFDLPTTIEMDSKGNFFVNERGNERVQKFDSKWNPILAWGSKGTFNNQFCHIEHLELDRYDNVYVTDPQSDPGCSKQPRVLKFDSNGKFITKFGSFGKEPGQFRDPEHLALDNEGNVYVSDRKNNNVQVFRSSISN